MSKYSKDLGQKNREFKTVDLITMFGLVGVVATLSGVVLARSLEDDRPTRTRITAEALTLQLVSQLRSTVASASFPAAVGGSAPAVVLTGAGRGPASVSEMPQLADGELSRDPWGHAFHYHLGVTASGHRRVIVWSDGPNHASDSSESVRILELAKNPSKSSTGRETGRTSFFRGDDIGFVHED